MYKLMLLIVLFNISGCGWIGIEFQEPAEEEVSNVNTRQILPAVDKYHRFTVGKSTISELNQFLGSPIDKSISKNTSIYTYTSRNKIRSGFTICLVLIPIPLRSEENGKYIMYFTNNTLTRIVSFTTKGEFYGVYADDSGSGFVFGEKSKCNV